MKNILNKLSVLLFGFLFVPPVLSNIPNEKINYTLTKENVVCKEKGVAECSDYKPPIPLYYHRKLEFSKGKSNGKMIYVDSVETKVNFWYFPSVDSAVISTKSFEDTLTRKQAINLLKIYFPEDSIIQNYSSDK
ncbi:MAG: hypothetical protein KKF48_04345 [Nanoarchaeota archaeon]|nr:hypothetical protein [Nanoarchaeota archaeon]MBU1028247.1 hypothetical protein [Nanoarchaeota archaeon]